MLNYIYERTEGKARFLLARKHSKDQFTGKEELTGVHPLPQDEVPEVSLPTIHGKLISPHEIMVV